MRRKKHTNAKKAKFDGIQFQSGLELVLYKMLKKNKINFAYEEKSYVLIEPFTLDNSCYERAQKRSKEMKNKKGKTVQGAIYTPDFVCPEGDWIIEVKGRKLGSFSLRWKLFQSLIQSWDKKPMLFMPTKQSDCEQVIKILLQKGYGK